MKELSPHARRVLELARDGDDPDDGARVRVERSLARRLSVGALVVGGGAAVSKSAAGAGLFGVAAKSLVVAGTAATLAVAGWQAVRSSDSVARAPAGSARHAALEGSGVPTANAPVPAASPAPRESPVGELPDRELANEVSTSAEDRSAKGRATRRPEPGIRGAAVASQHSVKRTREPAPVQTAASIDPLLLETRELREAQRALRGGDTTTALRLLDEQDARHGSGALAQERSAARVLALCESGRVERARQVARAFAERYPRSPLLGRVTNACW